MSTKNNPAHPSFGHLLMNSTITNLVGILLSHPIETFKLRFQTNHSTYFHLFHKMLKHEGPLGFYKGLSVPLVTHVPYYICTYSLTRAFEQSIHFEHPYQSFFYGGLSGFFGLFLYQPCELLKLKG